ncbi:MAG: FMN-binding negative transcriptional regulator [Anaerolineales bacterium]|nr:FMN-binding negative transcriptional regulator [Anaerolineales bacterium]MBP6210224.1 FMN-binding negative transcriptional regulator [Anaerolineales bacterium]
MYIPKYYREEDRQKILSFLKQNNFAALVTFDGEKPIATHAPVEVVESESGWTIYGHLSRANSQKKTFDGQEALLIFQGAHTYISARWYSEIDVPTWDYMIVHVYGKVREIQGDELYSVLSRLVQNHETNTSYRLEGLPQDMVHKEMKGVFGFAVDVTRVDGSYKLSQGKTEEERRNIAGELEKRGDENSKKIAVAIR